MGASIIHTDDPPGQHGPPAAVMGRPPRPEGPPPRAMRRAVLLGAHTHATTAGVNVHVYERGGKYLARGRMSGVMFGQNLGGDAVTAGSRLRHLLTEIEKGTFLRPSEARGHLLRNAAVPRLDLRQLCDEFLAEKRKLRGNHTAQDYFARLAPVLDFAERTTSLKRWPHAIDMDREFAIDLRVFLVNRRTTRNGRPGGPTRCLSARQVRNCLETLRAALSWAVRADVRKLPPEFVNPITPDVLGPAPVKDPLRGVTFPTDRRERLVQQMDAWQLLHLSVLMILPLRFEDVAGALISDIDFAGRIWRLGTRFGGSDFNKGRLTVAMPLPREFMPVLMECTAGRAEGPLFRSRAVWSGRRRSMVQADSREEIEGLLHRELAGTPAGSVLAERDRKQVFRQLLRRMGGVSEDELARELKALFRKDGAAARPYDLRGSVTQDLKDADLRHLELRYLTEHSVGDILNEYVTLDPAGQMAKYFRRIEPLLAAVASRARSWDVRAAD